MRRLSRSIVESISSAIAYRPLGATLIVFLAFTFAVAAQSPDTEEPAPPPVRLLSKGERSQLESQTDPKKRLEIALQLMDGRVKKAEELRMAEDFDAMYLELGAFHGLMDNSLDFLRDENKRRGKALMYFKKYEMGLRTFTPRLELIRRDLPMCYEPYVGRLLKYLRDARSKAIEPFFSDSIIPNNKPS